MTDMNEALISVMERIFDSEDTTVGGGAASALSGAMAAGMIGMVARLSAKKPVNLTVEEYGEIAEECDKLTAQLQQGAVNDMLAYRRIVDAFRLPKETEEEKAERKEAIQAAAIYAAEVPRDNGRLNTRVHALGQRLRNHSNPACISDLMSALYLSAGGIKDCALNINANLGMIKDEQAAAGLKNEMTELLLQAISS